MTPQQRLWALARDQLAGALKQLGYPEEMADMLARELKSPKAIDRLTSYLYQARPASVEMIADETLAIAAEIEAWRAKKDSREAQSAYNTWLGSPARWENGDDD